MRFKVREYQTYIVETIIECEKLSDYDDDKYDFIEENMLECVQCNFESITNMEPHLENN